MNSTFTARRPESVSRSGGTSDGAVDALQALDVDRQAVEEDAVQRVPAICAIDG